MCAESLVGVVVCEEEGEGGFVCRGVVDGGRDGFVVNAELLELLGD